MAEVGVVLFSPVVLRCKTGGSVVEDVFVVEQKFPVRVIVSSKTGLCLQSAQICTVLCKLCVFFSAQICAGPLRS